MYTVHNAVYFSLKTGPNDHSLSVSGLLSRNKVLETPYNHNVHLLSPACASPPTSNSTILVKMGALNETSDEKRSHVSIDSEQVDTGAQLDASLRTLLDTNESLRIR